MQLLLIDDHPLFRQGLISALNSHQKQIKVAEAASVSQAINTRETTIIPELILLDIDLEIENGLERLESLQHFYPEVPVVIISASQEPWQIQWAQNHGVKGFIKKSASIKMIIDIITDIQQGGYYWLQPHQLNPLKETKEKINGHAQNPLTDRQQQVLSLLAKGLPNKRIAQLLTISDTTVRTHVTDILKTLNACNRTEAVYYASQHGWLKKN